MPLDVLSSNRTSLLFLTFNVGRLRYVDSLAPKRTVCKHHYVFIATSLCLLAQCCHILHADIPFHRARPFSFSFRLLTTSDPATEELTWLILTSSAARLRQRREIIHSTWQNIFRSVPFKAYFIIGTPGPEWLPITKQENDTYDDMNMLQSHADDKEFAIK